ncbi:hypothetical protein [Streptococcus gordonii]|uniref:Uncharacterized protein n=1 Tax=Streptococcus gordonii TaxID=1302 RepID=A0AB35FTK4_STRGN|nr:hypothetical protein [Streptococcus gordonii]MBZ2127337.1 hypothetical protein [Streptococcus gordonii]MBZ2129404.1 hypothetical protein [Streptococcus gordonii]
MGSVEKFYSIIEEKQSDYKNVFEFLRTFISSEKEVSYTASRIRIDKKWGRLPPVNTMIRLAPIFDKTFFETCLREKLDSAKIRDKDVEVGQKYLLKVDSTQNTTEEERLRKLKRKLKREMHLEKSWGI